VTDEIFSRDAYQASTEATVVEVRDDGIVSTDPCSTRGGERR
jgi:hypothetical protein